MPARHGGMEGRGWGWGIGKKGRREGKGKKEARDREDGENSIHERRHGYRQSTEAGAGSVPVGPAPWAQM